MPRKKLAPEVIDFLRKIGSKGGKNAAASMTPEQRIARARKAVNSSTPEERSERARKAVAAREALRKARKRAR
jgi:hypothetical protein